MHTHTHTISKAEKWVTQTDTCSSRILGDLNPSVLSYYLKKLDKVRAGTVDGMVT